MKRKRKECEHDWRLFGNRLGLFVAKLPPDVDVTTHVKTFEIRCAKCGSGEYPGKREAA